MLQCVVARPINGISINGLEYVLDEFGEVKRFNSKHEAISYLKQKGLSKIEIENIQFINNY